MNIPKDVLIQSQELLEEANSLVHSQNTSQHMWSILTRVISAQEIILLYALKDLASAEEAEEAECDGVFDVQ